MRKKTFLPNHLDSVDFTILFAHLKEHPQKPQSERVEEILCLLSSIGGGLSRPDALRAITHLRHALRRYRWERQVVPTREGFRAVLLPAEREKLSPDDVWEYGAVCDLLDIAQKPEARSRLRRCAICDGWLFASSRSTQQFCSAKCRQYNYDNAPGRRELHRAAMRQHYALQKELERNAKQRVGIKEMKRTAK